MKTLAGILILIFLASSIHCKIVQPNVVVSKSDEFVTVGSSFDFSCRLSSPSESVSSCILITPSADYWTVENGQVIDENGNVVPGYSSIDEGEPNKVCGINIASVASSDLGDWTCAIERVGGATDFVRMKVNLRTDGFVPDVRLPRNTIPLSYNLSMIIILDPDFIIDGAFSIDTRVTLDFVNTGYLTLHSKFMNLNESSITLTTNGQNLNILEHNYDYDRELYSIQYDMSSITTDFDLTISGKYTGSVVEEYGASGCYKDLYVDRDTGVTKYIAATQFETSEARWAFPCFDEPDLKATFDIRIGRKTNEVSLSNAPVIASGESVEGYPGYVWDVFGTTPKQSTYIVAFAVGEFLEVTSDPLPNDVVFKTWARPDHINDGIAEYARDIGPRIVAHFEQLLDVNYPLEKQFQIAFPNKGGAMENWGLVTYGEYALLIDDAQASVRDKSSITAINAHELAHQWFGDLVTTKWWNDIWLNEGFASAFQYSGSHAVAPEQGHVYRFYVEEMRSILRDDAKPDSKPTLSPVNHPGEAMFNDLIYNRGATMLRMIETFLTRPTLIKGLTAYLKDFSFGSAVTDDLWFELNKAGHEDGTLGIQYEFKEIMDPWFKQQNYPLVTVKRNYETGTVTFTQERFLTEEDNSGDAHNFQWYIPLTFTYVESGVTNFNDSRSKIFLEPNSILNLNLGVSDGPLIVNLKALGYYRVNYDAENWNRIETILNGPSFTDIDPINRAQILYDAYALAVAGIESFDLALRMAQYLGQETEYVPLSNAIYIWNELRDSENLDSSAQQLRDSLLAVFVDKYNELGIDYVPSNSFLENYVQGEIIRNLCLADVPECVVDAVARFSEWMVASEPELPENNPVSKEIRYPVYCVGLRNGGQAELDFLTEVLSKTINPHEVRAINFAISSCAPSKEFIAQELIKSENKLSALEGIVKNPEGVDIALTWIANECTDKRDGMPLAFEKNLVKILRRNEKLIQKSLVLEELKLKCGRKPLFQAFLMNFGK